MNIRAQAYWTFRELLDPNNPEPIALPPDRELRADLTAPRFKMMVSGIQIESKDDVKKRLGRSTDCGDAAVLAFWDDPRALWAQSIGRKIPMVQPYEEEGGRLFGGSTRTERDWAAIARSKWTKTPGRTTGGRRVTY